MTNTPWWLIGPELPAVGFSTDNGARIDFAFSSSQTKIGFSDVTGCSFASVGVWGRLLSVDEVVHLMKYFEHDCQCALCVEGRRK